MSKSDINAKVNADLKLTAKVNPLKSQVFLVWAVLFCGLLVIVSMYLFMHDKNEGWFFAVIALPIFWLIMQGWNKSQPDSDLDNAHPTTIKLPDGTSISTDPRTLRTLENAQAFTQIVQEALHRVPLPTPSGMVSENLVPIPNSEDRAKEIVNGINLEIKTSFNQLLDALNLSNNDVNVFNKISYQEPLTSKAPPNEESFINLTPELSQNKQPPIVSQDS